MQAALRINVLRDEHDWSARLPSISVQALLGKSTSRSRSAVVA
jgi:hypothetical protein